MIIGLHGKARSGKDTALGFIRDGFPDHEIDHRFFAESLKKSAAHALGVFENEIDFCERLKGNVSISVINDDTHQAYDISGREYLQFYGTEAHRDIFGYDFWVDQTLPYGNPIKSDYHKNGKVIVITDVRFPNEAERIKELGGYIVHIIRPAEEKNDDHASEQTLPSELVDFEILNDTSLEAFEEKIIQISRSLIPPLNKDTKEFRSKMVLDID